MYATVGIRVFGLQAVFNVVLCVCLCVCTYSQRYNNTDLIS